MTILVAPAPPARRTGDSRHAMVAVAQVRLMILLLIFAAGVLAILARLALLGIFSEPANGGDRTGALTPLRADLVDRNGAPLARTIDAWSIAVRPKDVISDKVELAARLAELMPERSAATYLAVLNSDRTFVYLKRRAVPDLVSAVNALGDPGIAFAREPERLYPQSSLAAHVLGYLDFEGRGVAGMEKVLDGRLSDPASRGQPVALSLDARVQAALESELGTAMATFSARGAGGIVLDVATGEVIAMTSLPTFNPNQVGASPPENLRNITTQSVFELGSTFKPITMATALDTGVVASPAQRWDATHPLKVGGFTIHDERGDPKRWLTMPEILIYSSNIATARVADEVGPERMQAMFRKLGFDQRPQIELREKGRPLWPTFWARTTTMTTAYGHGIAITPLQLASAYAALVDGGIWRPATLLKVAPGKAAAGRRVISEATSARLRQMLRLVVLRGTGRKGEAFGYRVGGKTGTAEAAVAGGYDRSRNVATFAAAFPMDAPRYVVLAMLDSPLGTKETGGWKTAAYNAAPVVGRVIARTGAILGVTPDARRDIDESDLLPLLYEQTDPSKAGVE